MSLPTLEIVIFATKHGLSRMKPDGTELVELLKLAQPPSQVLAIQTWTLD
jgi:hypothetical protein